MARAVSFDLLLSGRSKGRFHCHKVIEESASMSLHHTNPCFHFELPGNCKLLLEVSISIIGLLSPLNAVR